MRNGKLTIVFSGMIAGDPFQGGATWAILQYLLGFRRLGHDVFFVEPVKAASVRPAGTSLDRSRNADYFRSVVKDFDLAERVTLIAEGTRETIGLPYSELQEIARRADVLFNVSGMLTDWDLIGHIPVRVYLDLDPAFIQLWNEVEKIDMHFGLHTHFVTIGQTIGQADCRVPTCGRNWITTPQPIVLDHWPVAGPVVHNALTTVGHWRGYGSIEHDGVFYGQKAHSLRPLIALPTRTDERFLLALGIHPEEKKDLTALAEHGWELVDPAQVAATPQTYQNFIQGSKGEFGIAKSGYVNARCGWFSDRSLCYLASGRPVIAQETGFRQFVPVGRGIFSFENIDDVLAAIEAINSDYGQHGRAAREIAESCFDSDKVLGRLLHHVGGAP